MLGMVGRKIRKAYRGRQVPHVSLLRFAGSSFYGEPSNKNLLAVAEINDAFVESFYLEQYLLEGRYPLNENEIVLTQDFIDDNGLTFSVGDTIQLLLGTRVWDEIDTELYGLVNFLGDRESFHPDTTERTYTIVGIVSEIFMYLSLHTHISITVTVEQVSAHWPIFM